VSALERLDAIDTRTAMATGGPWASEARFVGVAIESGSKTVAVVTNLDADAHFMAHARDDVPVMATALRAILNLHEPVRSRRWAADICAGCSTDIASFAWPCATVRIIETELAR
jgi:biotin carboxylase